MYVELMLRDDRRTFMTNAVNDVTNGFMGTKITNVRVVTVSTLLTKVTNKSSAVVTLLRRKYFALDIF